MRRYYFDWAATAIPERFSETEAYLRQERTTVPFANPSSKHSEGRAAREALEDARRRCADILNVHAEQLYWTSGGTESGAIVLFSRIKHFSQTSGGLLCGVTEHPAILENCKTIKNFGLPVGFVGIDGLGAVTGATLERALEKQKNTGMISIMLVNNETGSIADIKSLVSLARKKSGRPIFFHSDMVQALGKMPINLYEWDVDAASFAAHKIGGPRGIGLLYLKNPVDVLISGGGQESGIRSGTENLDGALAFTACIEKYAHEKTLCDNYNAAQERARYLIEQLGTIERCAIVPKTRVDAPERFLPNILLCAFDKIPGEVMARLLDDAGFAVSTGSACASAQKKHPVLEAMGIDSATTFNVIRISHGWSTTKDDIDALLAAINNILQS
jgi:cysteine desulfurase